MSSARASLPRIPPITMRSGRRRMVVRTSRVRSISSVVFSYVIARRALELDGVLEDHEALARPRPQRPPKSGTDVDGAIATPSGPVDAMAAGPSPTGNETAAWNVPSPLPHNTRGASPSPSVASSRTPPPQSAVLPRITRYARARTGSSNSGLRLHIDPRAVMRRRATGIGRAPARTSRSSRTPTRCTLSIA